MSGLEVLAAGPLATLQDRGRAGLAAIGVSGSGAADRQAAALANRLVGNGQDAAVIESLLGGLRLRTAELGAVVAVTGAAVPLLIGHRPWPAGAAAWVPPHTEVKLGAVALGATGAGLRAYLAVRGGIEVPAVLGSRSHDTLSKLGPPPLAARDRLGIGEAVDGGPWWGPPVGPTLGSAPVGLDAVIGPRDDWIDIEALARTPWEVSTESDRVGVRLRGAPVTRRDGELPTEGIVRGAVQLPPDGRPVIFGPDHPTTGGYPVVAVLTDAASDRLAQCPPGTAVRLRLRRPTWPR